MRSCFNCRRCHQIRSITSFLPVRRICGKPPDWSPQNGPHEVARQQSHSGCEYQRGHEEATVTTHHSVSRLQIRIAVRKVTRRPVRALALLHEPGTEPRLEGGAPHPRPVALGPHPHPPHVPCKISTIRSRSISSHELPMQAPESRDGLHACLIFHCLCFLTKDSQ